MNEQPPRIGYVVKRYPRFSETFVVNEILAHESAGADLEIFALRPPVDTHFQNGIADVRASVNYLPSGSVKSSEFWKLLNQSSKTFSELWTTLEDARSSSVGDVYQSIHLANVIKQRRISHLHAHFASSAATVAMLAAKIAGIGYSVTMHAKDIFHESVDNEDLQTKIRDARFVVTVSQFNRQFLSRKFSHASKIHCIYNGLDLDAFPFNKCAGQDNRIIAVGRLVPKKGFSVLVDAIRLLREANVSVSCDIIGDGELKSELANQIRSCGLTNQVNLLGSRPQSDVKSRISKAALMTAPCVIGDDGNRDGLPTVITEALALGTPCVATDVTGIPEIVRHEQTGLIAKQGCPQDLARAIKRLIDDRDLRFQLTKNARHLIEREFDIHQNVAKIRELFPLFSNQPAREPHLLEAV